MSARQDETWLFVVDWFDPMPQLKRKYLLKYFVDQNCVEMVDLKSKKMFLKKSPCPSHISREDFYVGGKVLLYARELEIVDYGDQKTKDVLSFQVQQCVLLLPASCYSYWGKVIDEITTSAQPVTITQIKTVQLAPNTADRICSILEENIRKSAELSEGVTLAILCSAEGAFSQVQNSSKKFQDQYSVTMFQSSNGLQSADLSEMLFGNQQIGSSGTTATLDHCTCCIIKPHAVKAKQMGTIIDMIIAQGYEISAVRSLQFEKAQAEEFLEVYKSVVPEYTDHVLQLCSGLSVALELRAENAVQTFRVSAGPWDVEMAKELRPDTIRGRYGIDKVMNAVHCTDLPEDAELECEYCFKLL